MPKLKRGRNLGRKSKGASETAKRRANETGEESERRIRANTEAQTLQRARESSLERQARQAADAATHSSQRERESAPECEARQAVNTARMSSQRARESSPERQQRQQTDALARANLRANETEDEREQRLADNRERMPRSYNTARVLAGDELNLPPQYTPGSMTVICEHCNSLSFQGESFTCCHSGKVSIPEYAFPEALESLYKDQTPNAKNFRQYIRKYNTLFSFASMTANLAPPPGRGAPIFRICGQVYHRTASLYPSHNKPPSFNQLYIYQVDQANNYRLQNPVAQNCSPDVMEVISQVLEEHNPYAYHFKNMHQVILEEKARAQAAGEQPSEVSLYLRTGPDRRRYNAPLHDEVAAIFTGANGAPEVPPDVVVYPHSDSLRKVSIYSPNCDPMSFPLFFPSGEPGWQPNVPHVADHATAVRTNTTLLQYCTYRWADRGNFNPLLYGGYLTQQKMVDDYVKVEAQRLEHQRRRQADLRVERLQGLHDHVYNPSPPDANDTSVPGHPFILPSSFVGSPSYMAESYQDAMSIIRVFGKPDLFITFTCNSHWPEIIQNLKPGQKTEDRPDLISRVFRLYLKEFFYDMNTRYILGKTDAHIHVIEFQKRGLPHAHILIHFSEEDKLKTPEKIDSLISAEIPDPELYPHLHHLVTTKMMHGPCGVLNPSNVCMEDGNCTKDFPRNFSPETTLPPNSYPQYRRRDNGRSVLVKGKPLDNRYVVPYNPYILCRYGAHINVEACTSISTVKYLYKYVYKGHDCAELELATDKGQQFIDGRYVSAPEAAWRLFEFRLQGRSHTVEKLPVHLPDMQSVFFMHGEEAAAVERAISLDTKLTAWFKLNSTHENARHFLFTEIPLHYSWVASKKKWQPRKRQQKVVTRLTHVSPRDTERYHLRILLLYVRGATSFDDIRTVDGNLCISFKEACSHRNLLQDDMVWKETLTEACSHGMPHQLRKLFAHMLLFCEISDPLLLWLAFCDNLMEDFTALHSENISQQKALSEIQAVLQSSGKTLLHFGLPSAEIDVPLASPFDSDVEGEIAGTFTLNDEQSRAAAAIMVACLDDDCSVPNLFFLNGPGGCGKTYTYNYMVHKVRSLSTPFIIRQASCSALTGIAATLLIDGKTAHSTFKIPIPCFENSTCPVSPKSPYADFLRSISLFIIDEVTMLSIHGFHAIDRLMRDITGNYNVPFGGKVFVFGGDFRQLLAVLRRASSTAILENTLSRSPIWQEHVQTFHLSHNMRLREGEQEFRDFLLDLGDGRLPQKSDQPFKDCIALPKQCVTETDIVEHFFPSNTEYNEQLFTNRAILCPTNQMSLDINLQVLDRVPGEKVEYLSVDSIEDDGLLTEEEMTSYPLEYLHSLTPSGMPPHSLSLKVGAVVMLLRNIDTNGGLTNGTRVVLKHLHQNYLDVQVLTGTAIEKRVFIPKMSLKPSDLNLPFTLNRRQFPIRLSYAMTINKSQGQTFEKIGIFLPKPCFSHGQLYVAFSRARSLADIRVKVITIPNQQGRYREITYTKNVVYKQVLQT